MSKYCVDRGLYDILVNSKYAKNVKYITAYPIIIRYEPTPPFVCTAIHRTKYNANLFWYTINR